MMRYKLYEPKPMLPHMPKNAVFVILRAGSAADEAAMEWEGDPSLIDQIRGALLEWEGFGGENDPLTTPADLELAMSSPLMRAFQPVRLEGVDVLLAAAK